VDSTGIIATIAGTGGSGSSGDGGPAALATLDGPSAVRVAPDGTVYIADAASGRVRTIGTDGVIRTVAGGGPTFGYNIYGNGIPATDAAFFNPGMDIELAPDGSFYVTAGWGLVRRVTPDGLIYTVAGSTQASESGDGGPATQATFFNPVGLALGPDGALYISDASHQRVRRVGPDGIVTGWAGQHVELNTPGTFSGDQGPAPLARFVRPNRMVVAPDGALYIADDSNHRVRRVAPGFPWLPPGDIFIPSAGGSEVYVFDNSGRHLRTLDGVTGGLLRQFGYDTHGRLTTIADGTNNVTTIERNAAGEPIAIVSPYGQLTTLTLDANGYLAGLSGPGGQAHAFAYTAEGLMTTMTDARGHMWTFAYDEVGRLIRDDDPAGGFKTLERTETGAQEYTVTVNTALGRSRSYQVEKLSVGGERWTNTGSDGLQTVRTFGLDGTGEIVEPNGTGTLRSQSPDPRFGMQAPLATQQVSTAGGLVSGTSTQRAVTLADPNDLLSLTSLVDTRTVNGRVYQSSYDAATRTFTDTTPAGRQTVRALDALGRTIQSQVTGLAPTSMTYDARGRLATITHGTGAEARTTTLDYDSSGNLAIITDAAGRQVSFGYDTAGRMTSQMLPDGRVIAYGYDANGNMTLLTPPSRPDHTFDYTPVDLQSLYAPPSAGLPTPNTQYLYNLDRQLSRVTRPDGLLIDFLYDTAGRLSSQVLPGNQSVTYSYDPATGNLITITAPDGGTLSFTYDGNLLLSENWAGTVSGSVSRTYDNDFRVTSQSVNSANTVSFNYDADSLLTGTGALTVTRDPQTGLITGTTLGVVTDSSGYSNFAELSSYSASVDGSPVFDVQYTRDALGRITEKTETVQGTSHTYAYNYDLAGRLTDVMIDANATAQYAYDTNSNRIGGFTPSGAISATYDDQDRLLTYGAVTYGYTANGELQTKADASGTTTYTYDVLGNLIAVTLADGSQVQYVIDGQNRRVGKKVNGTVVQGFLYDGQLRIVAELDGPNAVVSRFAYGEKPNVPDYMIKGGITYRFISDHLGSPRLVINTADGTIVQRLDYDEFGNVILDTNPGFQPFGFAGGLYDRGTQLVRFGARDYDPVSGRWTAKDPLFFDGGDTNLYGYVLDDPINRFDPLGLKSCAPNEFREVDWLAFLGCLSQWQNIPMDAEVAVACAACAAGKGLPMIGKTGTCAACAAGLGSGAGSVLSCLDAASTCRQRSCKERQ